MGDKWTEVMECYDLEVVSSAKGRYAQIVETDRGVMQLRPQSGSDGRLRSEFDFKERLFNASFGEIDRLIHNQDGELATADRYGTMYVLRRYFHGREISMTNMSEIDRAVENLARLHLAGRMVWTDMCDTYEAETASKTKQEKRSGDNEINEYTAAPVRLPVVRMNYDLSRRNRELKRVRAYISRMAKKSRFEEVYLDVYNQFYIQAQHSESKMAELLKYGCTKPDICAAADDEKTAAGGLREINRFSRHIGYCHGDYNNHNLLVTVKEKRLATVGFDKFYVGNQLADLYYFARKAVEKNGYSFDVLGRILDGYAEHIGLSEDDYTYIYLLFSYPEKFYKLSSQYLNGSKTRISPVMLDKLDRIIGDEQKKQKILSKYREIFLHI